MNLSNIKRTITLTVGRGGLLVKKYSPEILLGTGITGLIGSTVLACRATLKADEVINEAKGKLERIKYAHESTDELYDKNGNIIVYDENVYRRDLTFAYIQTGVEFIKLYGPALTLSVMSIGCILVSHGIMKKRNLALVAAYKAIEQSFADYRKRVVDKYGAEQDRKFKYGISEVEVTKLPYTDENGKKHKAETTTVDVFNPNGLSMYARLYTSSNREWSDYPDYNETYIKSQQRQLNDLLQSRGHVFLNEVYDELGFERTTEGQIVGWVKGHGDDCIDITMLSLGELSVRDLSAENDAITDRDIQDAANGRIDGFILDFNVDGPIYNMI